MAAAIDRDQIDQLADFDKFGAREGDSHHLHRLRQEEVVRSAGPGLVQELNLSEVIFTNFDRTSEAGNLQHANVRRFHFPCFI